MKNAKLLGLRLTLELQSRVGSPVFDIHYFSTWPEVHSPPFDFFQFIFVQNALPPDINLILILEPEAIEKNPLSSQADPAIPDGVGPITQIHNDERSEMAHHDKAIWTSLIKYQQEMRSLVHFY